MESYGVESSESKLKPVTRMDSESWRARFESNHTGSNALRSGYVRWASCSVELIT